MTETRRRLTSAVLAAALAGGVLALFPSDAHGAAGDISLFAGPSTITAAPFQPTSVSFATAGTGARVYFTDIANDEVDFFDTMSPGTVVVAAGTGKPGAGADNVAGNTSALNTPTTVFATAATVGATTQYTVWVTDTANNRVRKIAPDGTITTVAGTGSPGSGSCPAAGTATGVALNGPQGVVADSAGNLFISDTNDNCITQVASGSMSPFVTGLNSPRGLAFNSGEATTTPVYAVDEGVPSGGGGTGEVLKFACSPGTTCTSAASSKVVAGGGFNNNAGGGDSNPGGLPAVGPGACPTIGALELQSPQSVALDTSASPPNVLVADGGNDEIHKVTQGANNCLNTSTDFAGTPGKAGFSGDGGSPTPNANTTPLLNFPEGVTLASATNVFIADTGNTRLRQVTGAVLSTVAVGAEGFTGDNGPATQALLDQPVGVAVDTTSGPSAGAAYIADSLNNRIRRVSAAGTITTIAGTGTGGSGGDLGPATSAQLSDPSGVAVDSSGNVFIADTGNNKVREVKAADGTIATVAGNGGAGSSGNGGPATQAQLNQPRGVAVDTLGNLYIADTLNNDIRRVNLASGVISDFEHSSNNPQSAQNQGNIKHPWAVAVDSKNNVFWTDTEFNQVDSAPTAGGGSTLVAGNGTAGNGGDGGPAAAAQLDFPKGLAVDSSGTVYIGDSVNNKVRSVSSNTIKTLAGNGAGGYQGDPGPAASAELNGPTGLALTPAGDLLIGDTLNSRVRRVTNPAAVNPPPTTTTTTTGPPPGGAPSGYWFVASDGGIFSFGDAGFHGSTGGTKLNKPVVGMANTPSRGGYWLVASDGGIFSFGDAAFHGSTGAIKLNSPVVGMASTPSGNGYWLVASDGGIFSFGDAAFHGSTGAIKLNRPVVGMASTPSGNGYWLVASDGGMFAFGDAGFFGSTGGTPLNKPVVGMASTPSGNGYWLVASDGGIFSFGDAGFFGSTGAIKLNQPVVGMARTGSGKGYWFVASDGGIFSFGDAQFHGSTGGTKLNQPVVGMAGFQG